MSRFRGFTWGFGLTLFLMAGAAFGQIVCAGGGIRGKCDDMQIAQCPGTVDVNTATVEQLTGCQIPLDLARTIVTRVARDAFDGYDDLRSFFREIRVQGPPAEGLIVIAVEPLAGVNSVSPDVININVATRAVLDALRTSCGVSEANITKLQKHNRGAGFTAPKDVRDYLRDSLQMTSCSLTFKIGPTGTPFRL